jgi:hypothetical protein
MPPPSPPDPALVAWSKAQCHADRLFEALDSLDSVGGPQKAAATGRWSPAATERAIDSLCAAREALDAAIGRLEARARFFPRRMRVGPEGRRRRIG